MLDLVCGNDPIKYDTLPCTLHIPWCILWHWSSSHIENRSRISYPVTSLVYISSGIIRIIITFPCTYMIPYRLPNFPANDINVSVFPYLTWLLQASPWAKHVRNDEWPKDHQNRCGLKWVLQESVRIFGAAAALLYPRNIRGSTYTFRGHWQDPSNICVPMHSSHQWQMYRSKSPKQDASDHPSAL